MREADRVVERILEEGVARSVADRRTTVALPRAAGAEGSDGAGPAPEPEQRVLTLEEALDVAIRTGRDYVSQKESLYLTALSISGTRHAYSPQLSALLAYTFADSDDGDASQGVGASAGMSQVLPWGADFGIDLSTGFDDVDWDGTFSSSAAIRYSQPLLRGAGHAIAYESLIQAERDLIYAIRSFERFRESYAIDVARRYYDLVQQEQALENQRGSLVSLEFGRRQAEAKFEMGEIKQVEVLRARRSELSGANDLLRAEEDLELALDRFRVFLGLPDEVRLQVVATAPEFVPVALDVDSAVEVALHNRLDYLTAREQLEDSERGVAIARDGLKSSLDLNLSYVRASDPERAFGRQGLDDQSWSAGLTWDLPVDRVRERNAYRATQIGHTRALRDFEEFEDNLVVELRNRFRTLRRIELSLEIQRESIRDEERNKTIAKLLFERGENSNRDVIEAEENLLEAQNALVGEQVDYEIERLNLLRDMGVLFIDGNGLWEDATAAAHNLEDHGADDE